MKSKKPLVSVLMPAYNAHEYIEESIKSILVQTYTHFELIICDDHSTDETWKIISRYAKKDKRIIALRNRKNLYIAANRNKLISLAKGVFIAWQDADDISFPTRIAKQVAYLQTNPRVGIVGGYLEFFENGIVTSIRKYAQKDKELRSYIFRYSPVAQPGAMLRRQCFKEFGLYNLKYPPAEDIDMSFRIGTKWKFANLQEPVIKYRVTNNSATFKKLKHQFFSTFEVRNAFARNTAYQIKTSDYIINYLQLLAIMILPSSVAVWLFTKIRNTT